MRAPGKQGLGFDFSVDRKASVAPATAGGLDLSSTDLSSTGRRSDRAVDHPMTHLRTKLGEAEGARQTFWSVGRRSEGPEA